MADEGGGDGIWFFALEAARLPGGRRTPTSRWRWAYRCPHELTELDIFLTHRWRGFAPLPVGLGFTPVEHEPWPLRSAAVRHLDETLLVAAGLPGPRFDPIVHYSPGVRVRLGAPRLVAGPSVRRRRGGG